MLKTNVINTWNSLHLELISFYIYSYLYALEEILYMEIECHGLLLFIFSQLFLDDRDSLTVMVGVFEQRLQIRSFFWSASVNIYQHTVTSQI